LVWLWQGPYRSRSTNAIPREEHDIEQYEFDLRLSNFISEGFESLGNNPKEWLKFVSGSKNRPPNFAHDFSANAHH
jgi:hypothetical protein